MESHTNYYSKSNYHALWTAVVVTNPLTKTKPEIPLSVQLGTGWDCLTPVHTQMGRNSAWQTSGKKALFHLQYYSFIPNKA